MVRRVDENNIDLEIKELHSYPVKHVIASVEDSKKEAEVEALRLRLQGKKAFVQNGLMGKYEVLTSETRPELRNLTADFKEVGTGIYRLANPEWDKGSLWSIYSMNDDGSIVVSRMEDEDEESREALVANLLVKSNVSNRTAAAYFRYSIGDTMDYVDPDGLFTEGRVIDVDHRSGHYIVQNDHTFNRDFVPFNVNASDTDFVSNSDDASADDNFEFEPESHSEDAYTSNDSGADDEYSQNMTDVSGFESMDKFDQNLGIGGEDKVEASSEDEGTENGLDDIQKHDYSGDDKYEDVEDETASVGESVDVEAAFDYDLDQVFNGLDDIYQPSESEQESKDHYGFDQELYTKAENEGLDDTEQLDMNLQNEQGAEDVTFEEADDMTKSVGDCVEGPDLNYSETNEVQRDQMAKNKKDLWLI